MIWLYTGTPGSGKSLHAAKDIFFRLKRRKGGLICNFPILESRIPDGYPFLYLDNSELTVKRLVDFARQHHKVGKEGQTLIIIDECQILFNCRTFGKSDRGDWVKFFTQHRKLGYNIILITQNDRMIDKQIRALVEYEIRHRKLTNYGFGGKVLGFVSLLLFPLRLFGYGATWFLAIEYWYGGNGLKLSQEAFLYRQLYADMYDSYRMFDSTLPSLSLSEGKSKGDAGAPVAGGTRAAAPPRFPARFRPPVSPASATQPIQPQSDGSKKMENITLPAS